MNTVIKGKEVYFDEDYLHVKLEDNRIISTPIECYSPLKNTTILLGKSDENCYKAFK